MINKENLNKLYTGVLEGIELTTKELNSYGFNSRDLNDLIEKGNIIRVKRGLYSLKSVDELFYYGKQLIAQKEYDKATQCFQKCFEIDPTHKGACFQLFLRCIQNKDYKKAFEYFDIFYDSENEFYNADSNFYLYLLSMITELPENHREYTKFLKLEDIRVDFNDKRYTDIPKQNKMRLSALNQRFTFAAKQLNEIIQEKENLSVQNIVIKTLLTQAIEIQMQNKINVINLIKQKKYEELIEFYNKIASFHKLSTPDNYTFILTNELLNIIDTKIIPKTQIFSTKNVFEAIDGKNFELALSLVTERNQKYNLNKDDNAISLLLEEIISKIKEINEKVSQDSKIESNYGTINRYFDKTRNVETKHNIISNTITFADIIKLLMSGDLDNSFKALNVYLTNKNKSIYEFLIIDLIKISLLEKDVAFTKPMAVLTLISRDNYSFDISIYIQEFYINLTQNKFEEARIYLDIITKGNKLGQECIITDGLYQVLEASEKMLDYKKNSTILNVVDEALENSKKIQTINIQKQASYTKTHEKNAKPIFPIQQKSQVRSESIQKEKITKEKRDSEKEFMDKKYEELLDKKSIILLKSMNKNRINRILEMIKNYPNMDAFVIGENNKQQVVLKYKPDIHEYVDIKTLIELGNQAYKEKDYYECIKNYLELLQLFEKPNTIVYSKLGLSYMKIWKIPLAIDYLTIASDLAKKADLDYDFTDLIAQLKGNKEYSSKPHFKMTQKDFNYSDISNYYGIDNFVEINSFIIESGLDVETACEQLGLSFEKIDIIKLIYAREFYTQGNYDKGDMFLKSFEKSKNKTDKTKKIFDDIRKNKRFYQNRNTGNNIKLALTISPKKK